MRRRGFFTTDAIVGLAIVVMLATVLIISADRQRRASAKLSDTRAAARLAEESLTLLRAGEKVRAKNIIVRRLECEPPAKGMQWVEVTAEVEGRKASLAGVVAEGSVP